VTATPAAARGAGARRVPVAFSSSDGRTQVRGSVWLPEPAGAPRGEGAGRTAPRALVQIVHGMCEHVGRYDDFARFLARRGLAVCGHDQIGHGESAPPGRRGCLPPDGADYLVRDVQLMAECAQRLLRAEAGRSPAPGETAAQAEASGGDVPRVLLGHSMGSFVARVCAARAGDGLAGVVVSGTGHVAPAVSRFGNALARAVCALRGPDAHSELLHALADGAYSRDVRDARTPFDWLSHNVANVDAYIADDACGFPFSAGGYATLTDLTARACSPACARTTPHDLPFLIVSGADDAVGAHGKGVLRTQRLLRDAGVANVRTVLYDGMRHEILNEDGRERVYSDVADWVDEVLRALG
jgi:alpha-beta hydrolase superfamily lysophospholipase